MPQRMVIPPASEAEDCSRYLLRPTRVTGFDRVKEEIDELALLPGWPRRGRAIERAERLLDVLVERLVEAELLRPDDQHGAFVACQRQGQRQANSTRLECNSRRVKVPGA